MVREGNINIEAFKCDEVKDLEMGRLLTQYNDKSPYKREVRGSE